ncbi:MAG: host specificity factor TipJ family phage tail protein [Alphaproteobacteria bacterium]
MIHFSYITNPCEPCKGRINTTLEDKQNVWQIVETQKINLSLPTICYINGKPTLRKDWDKQLPANSFIAFVTLPLGGSSSSSNPLNVVLMVALVVATVVTGGAATAAWGVYWGAAAAAVVSIGGSMLINALVPTPKATLNGMTSSLDSSSPTYSLQAQGNSARLGNPIPVIYGRHIIYPDFAAEPYYQYIDNEQYLLELLCIGQGYYDIEQIRIEDTPLSSFDEIEYEIIPPGGEITLLREDVVTSAEVAGQELLLDETVGPFIINPTETVIDQIEVDIAFQYGLYYANDDGSMSSKTAKWQIEAQLIDDDDVEQGDWFTLASESITTTTYEALYKTYTYSVAEGRYQLRATRLDEKDTSSRAGHEVRWASVKGYIISEPDYSNVTLLAVKMRATDNLSQRSSILVNCIVTRKLPVWNGEEWSDLQATNSIAWALVDILKSDYGGGLEDKNIDLAGLLELDATWQDRGDTFNGVYDSKLTVYEALSRCAKVGRTVPIIQGGVVRLIRDEPRSLPVAMFGPRNIVKNSLSIQYIMPSDDTADSVTVQYFSDITWKTSEVTGSYENSTLERTATVELFGCTSKEQAYREAVYMALSNRYRRRIVTFSTELEGLIPSYGDLVTITHDMAKWGQGGEISSVDGRTLTLSEPVTFEEGQTYYLALRSKNGSLSGVYEVTAGDVETEVVLTEDLDCELLVGTDCERTHFAFGATDSWAVTARVTEIKPRSSQIDITAVIEDDRVHVN